MMEKLDRETPKMPLSGDDTDVDSAHYASLITCIKETSFINDRLSATFHFLKYNDCVDRENDFLDTLSGYLVQYCFSKKRYESASIHDIQRLFIEGRNKFFNPKDSNNGRSGASRSGELGEIALYFLLESFLKCPQIVSKMSLKTTQGENYKGSDGIHVGIIEGQNCVFYCESKLNKVRDNAFADCINSVIKFHLTKKKFEISMVNNHIDIKDEDLRNAVLSFLDPTKPKDENWIEVNACFIGFDWKKFIDIEKIQPNASLMDRLEQELKSEITAIKKLLADKIQYPSIKHRFYFFVMPFKDIERLRKEFLKILYGGK